ncbi:hypothetical protein PM3016_6739 [Paenibacillus mucilaginosus 3016]|uniref:Uncharacterized protein n=1 Tax=Paenibacillus mucilaginosus 3016 TaxID=1116391 RepID=H6NNM4_9BACL|nr:hypothetical protein PM3016_6739 [Paenibacillus mucilaginosus 3016]
MQCYLALAGGGAGLEGLNVSECRSVGVSDCRIVGVSERSELRRGEVCKGRENQCKVQTYYSYK